MGNDPPKKDQGPPKYDVQDLKFRIELTIRKTNEYVKLQINREKGKKANYEKELVRMFTSPGRQKMDEYHKIQTIANVVNYINGAEIVQRYLETLLPKSLEIAQNLYSPDRLASYMPLIESIVWSTEKLNLNSLVEFSNLMKSLFGQRIVEVANSPNVDKDLRQYLSTTMATGEDMNNYIWEWSQSGNIGIDQINKTGHEFFNPKYPPPPPPSSTSGGYSPAPPQPPSGGFYPPPPFSGGGGMAPPPPFSGGGGMAPPPYSGGGMAPPPYSGGGMAPPPYSGGGGAPFNPFQPAPPPPGGYNYPPSNGGTPYSVGGMGYPPSGPSSNNNFMPPPPYNNTNQYGPSAPPPSYTNTPYNYPVDSQYTPPPKETYGYQAPPNYVAPPPPPAPPSAPSYNSSQNPPPNPFANSGFDEPPPPHMVGQMNVQSNEDKSIDDLEEKLRRMKENQ